MTLSQRARDSLDRMMIAGLRQSMGPAQSEMQIRTVPDVAQESLTHMAVL